jgi:hypothetical protein
LGSPLNKLSVGSGELLACEDSAFSTSRMQDILAAQRIAIVAVQIVNDLASHGMSVCVVGFVAGYNANHSKAPRAYS